MEVLEIDTMGMAGYRSRVYYKTPNPYECPNKIDGFISTDRQENLRNERRAGYERF